MKTLVAAVTAGTLGFGGMIVAPAMQSLMGTFAGGTAVTCAPASTPSATPSPTATTAPGEVSAPVSGKQVTLDADQLGYARTIIDTGAGLKVPARGQIVAIAVALQESTLQNLDWGDRDSLGLFQQRAPWGTKTERLDPATSATKFYTHGTAAGTPGLLKTDGWEGMTVNDAAQAVQRSGFPRAYEKWEKLATRAVSVISGGVVAQPEPTCVMVTPTPSPSEGPAPPGICPLDPGDWPNGRIPVDKLCPVPWAKRHHLRGDALAALIPIDTAFKERFGKHLCITDSYRTYEEQVDLFARKPGLAARPGHSNHGLGRALDLCSTTGGTWLNGTDYDRWMHEQVRGTEWRHPGWAEPGGSRPESWHWSFGVD